MILPLLAASVLALPTGSQSLQGGYDVWGDPPGVKSDTPVLKDRDSYIRAVGNATVGMAKQLQQLKNDGKVLDPSKTLMPVSVPIADEVRYIMDCGAGKMSSDGVNRANKSLTYVVAISAQPSVAGLGNPFVAHTKNPAWAEPTSGVRISRELALAKLVASSGGDLLPADIMRLSLEACRGDYPSAMLTAHNFLKEVGYATRGEQSSPVFCVMPSGATDGKAARQEARDLAAKIGGGFTVSAVGQGDGTYKLEVSDRDAGRLVSKLKDLRPPDDVIRDKMGPWYHSFIGLVIGPTAVGGSMTAETWAKVEGLLRNLHYFGLFSSPPDYFKELLTERMASEGGNLMEILQTSLTITPRRREADMGEVVAIVAEPKRPSTRSQVWYKWTIVGSSPTWNRSPNTSKIFDKSGEYPVTAEMYDDLKMTCLAKASAVVVIRDKKVVKGSWNLVSATMIKEAGFKEQVVSSTGGNNIWSGDPMGGDIYRSTGWGWERTPYVSPLKYEAHHIFQIPKAFKPKEKVKVRLAIQGIKYTKVHPSPQERGYTMATGMYINMGFDPNNLGGLGQLIKAVYDGSKDMNAPEPVESTVEFVAPDPDKRDWLIWVRIGNSEPYVVFELRFRLN